MNGIYLGLFRNVPLWDSSGLYFSYSRHIEVTKSFEFASVAICSTFFHKMTGLPEISINYHFVVIIVCQLPPSMIDRGNKHRDPTKPD